MAHYVLRNVEQETWEEVKRMTKKENRSIRSVLLVLIDFYVKHGLPKQQFIHHTEAQEGSPK